MQRILLFSHSGFSDENANGITMKNLLSAWSAEEKAEFYCGTENPDFSAAHHYFRVTDLQAIKSFLGKNSRHVFSYTGEQPQQSGGQISHRSMQVSGIPAWLKKFKYNFAMKWLREFSWTLGPWGHRQFWNWVDQVSPDVIFYMVGESLFMDRQVLRTCKKTGKPLILYNGEAYRIIDLNTRRGLERLYYHRCKVLYRNLCRNASMMVYNSNLLKVSYETEYPTNTRSIIAYNSAECIREPYTPKEDCVITYFGNLGVGRSAQLLRVAEILKQVDASLMLNIYGNADEAWKTKFEACSNICYHGFVKPQELRSVIAGSDILLHVETFDKAYIPKLKYAFSTKIAQCLCAGRCFVSFAPEEMASSQYLKTVDGALLVSTEESLASVLQKLTSDPACRTEHARKVYQAGLKNHQIHITARRLREEIEEIANEKTPAGSDCDI